MHDKLGFDCNQDIPGNYLWEDLYRASPPNTKVILTVRDSDKQWWNSWSKFYIQEFSRGSIFGFSLFGQLLRLIKRGYMGAHFTATTTINDYIWDRFLIPDKLRNPPLFINEFIDVVNEYEDIMRKKYLEHIEHVKLIVPEEDLLIWNVKDGWKPLCQFLGRSTPADLTVPHENKTGDLTFNAKYTYGNKFTQVRRGRVKIELTLAAGFNGAAH